MSSDLLYHASMETQGLTEHQQQAWSSLHRIRMQLLPHLTRHLATHSELTEAEFLVLVSLSEAAVPAVRAKELCRTLRWEISRLSHQITRMEASGLVKRMEFPEDARSFQISVTELGTLAIERALPLQQREIRRCFGDVLTSEQLDCLIEIAEAISTHLKDQPAH